MSLANRHHYQAQKREGYFLIPVGASVTPCHSPNLLLRVVSYTTALKWKWSLATELLKVVSTWPVSLFVMRNCQLLFSLVQFQQLNKFCDSYVYSLGVGHQSLCRTRFSLPPTQEQTSNILHPLPSSAHTPNSGCSKSMKSRAVGGSGTSHHDQSHRLQSSLHSLMSENAAVAMEGDSSIEKVWLKISHQFLNMKFVIWFLSRTNASLHRVHVYVCSRLSAISISFLDCDLRDMAEGYARRVHL